MICRNPLYTLKSNAGFLAPRENILPNEGKTTPAPKKLNCSEEEIHLPPSRDAGCAK